MKTIPDGMLENLDLLIDLSAKKTALLIEFKKSLIYHSCKYHLVKLEQSEYSYLLIEIETKRTVKTGVIEEIETYLKRRNIETSAVYQDLKPII